MEMEGRAEDVGCWFDATAREERDESATSRFGEFEEEDRDRTNIGSRAGEFEDRVGEEGTSVSGGSERERERAHQPGRYGEERRDEDEKADLPERPSSHPVYRAPP